MLAGAKVTGAAMKAATELIRAATGRDGPERPAPHERA
jgi:hypothetical protein